MINIKIQKNKTNEPLDRRTKEEQKTWIEICEYIKKYVLEYGEEEKFPKFLATKLLGLRQGKYIANNNTKNEACYPYGVLLLTAKACKPKLLNYLHNNQNKIKDENHKINLIVKFMENDINDVYNRWKAQKNAQDKIENMNFEHQFSDRAEYTRKTGKTPKGLENLW